MVSHAGAWDISNMVDTHLLMTLILEHQMHEVHSHVNEFVARFKIKLNMTNKEFAKFKYSLKFVIGE